MVVCACVLMLHGGLVCAETFDIDYASPEKYLASGPQTTLTQINKEKIRCEVGDVGAAFDDVKAIFEWKKKSFTTRHAHGRYLGRRTVNDSLVTRTLTGCNDHAAMFAAVLRMYGFPAIVVNAAGIQWAHDVVDGKDVCKEHESKVPWALRLSGHAFVETYVEGTWILINSTSGKYIAEDYDPYDPAIPMNNEVEPDGYYSYSKGIDQASTGVHNQQDVRRMMSSIAPTIACSSIAMPDYEIESLVAE